MKSLMLGVGALLLFGMAGPMSAQDGAERDGAETLDDQVARIVEQLGSKSQTLREKAEQRLDELDKDHLDALKKHLEAVKRDGDVDLELKLRAAINRLEPSADNSREGPEEEDTTGENGKRKGRKHRDIPKDDVLTPEDIFKKFPSGAGIESIETAEETDDGERAQTITRVEGKKTITLKYDGNSRKFTAEIKDATTDKVESLEFQDEAEMAEKRPDLHDLWTGKPKQAGAQVWPDGKYDNGGGPDDILRRLKEEAGDKANQEGKAQEPEDRQQEQEQKNPPQEESKKQPTNDKADPKENKPQREEEF